MRPYSIYESVGCNTDSVYSDKKFKVMVRKSYTITDDGIHINPYPANTESD